MIYDYLYYTSYYPNSLFHNWVGGQGTSAKNYCIKKTRLISPYGLILLPNVMIDLEYCSNRLFYLGLLK